MHRRASATGKARSATVERPVWLTNAEIHVCGRRRAKTLSSLAVRRLMQLVGKVIIDLMTEALRETQTLRTGCSKTDPKIFALPQTPYPGGAGPPKFNQLEMVTTCSYRPSLVKIDARNFELSR